MRRVERKGEGRGTKGGLGSRPVLSFEVRKIDTEGGEAPMRGREKIDGG